MCHTDIIPGNILEPLSLCINNSYEEHMYFLQNICYHLKKVNMDSFATKVSGMITQVLG